MRISAPSESWRWSSEINRENGTNNSVGGMRYVKKIPIPSRSPQRPTSRARLYPAGTATATVITTTAATTTSVFRTQRGKSVWPSSSFTWSSVGGSAAREDVDYARVGRGVHDPEQHGDRDPRHEQRQLHLDQPPPDPGAVHDRRLDDLLRDRRQSREHDHGRERKNPPRLHDDDGEQGERRVAQPVQPAVHEARRLERPVDHAERKGDGPHARDRKSTRLNS